ncbi:MAG: hypothetical protein UT02_C0022G0006 [Parcubacteria group bacterium GW2011_GWC2_38_7]|nr:MAG: hypothetical protein UT02_C0022G0006 [Parcubacteria group bacterium GW2011_GWC2_38_7]
MEGKEPESKYLILWLCVFLTAGIIFVGWFVALRQNFSKINGEMTGGTSQTFIDAQQEVLDSFSNVQDIIKKTEVELDTSTTTVVPDTTTGVKTSDVPTTVDNNVVTEETK